MRIRYYCPECQKLSILTAVYTAEPRVCAWCGATIHSEHVKTQTLYQRSYFTGPFLLVGIVLVGYYLPDFWRATFYPRPSVFLERTWVQWWIMFLVFCVMYSLMELFLLVAFIEWCFDDVPGRDSMLNRQRKENKERAADQK